MIRRPVEHSPCIDQVQHERETLRDRLYQGKWMQNVGKNEPNVALGIRELAEMFMDECVQFMERQSMNVIKTTQRWLAPLTGNVQDQFFRGIERNVSWEFPSN